MFSPTRNNLILKLGLWNCGPILICDAQRSLQVKRLKISNNERIVKRTANRLQKQLTFSFQANMMLCASRQPLNNLEAKHSMEWNRRELWAEVNQHHISPVFRSRKLIFKWFMCTTLHSIFTQQTCLNCAFRIYTYFSQTKRTLWENGKPNRLAHTRWITPTELVRIKNQIIHLAIKSKCKCICICVYVYVCVYTHSHCGVEFTHE